MESIKNKLKSFDKNIKFYDEDSNENWDKLLTIQGCFYKYNISNSVNYYKEYFNAKSNHSFILKFQSETLINLFYESKNELIVFTPHVEISNKALAPFKCVKFYQNFIKILSKKNNVKFIYIPNLNFKVDSILFLYSKYYKVKYMSDMFVDLECNISDIWNSLRGSYRSIINKIKDEVKVIITNEISDFDDLRKFHFKIAKEETRSPITWEIQKNYLIQKQGIIFKLIFKKEIIGYSFFTYDSKFAYYDVGVYERNKFGEIGIAHKLIWESIKFFKERSLKAIFLGNTIENNDQKVSNIIKFKSGFSNRQKISCYITS